MLKISNLADYSFAVMRELSPHLGDKCSASVLSQRLCLPVATVSKVLKGLLDAGLLKSIQGAGGGYYLSKSANDINVAMVIEAIDGPLALTVCADLGAVCDRAQCCNQQANWQYVNELIHTVLANISLADMRTDLAKQATCLAMKECHE